MLQTQTVSAELLELLKNISKSQLFEDFVLVGGTGLALQIGHRDSVDLDFFGNINIDEDLFLTKLTKFGNVEKLAGSKNILICKVNEVKVDFVNHRYKFIDEVIVEEGLKLASKREIAAMKLNAIEGRGSKKDFIDLYFLLKEFSLSEMISFYQKKYPNQPDFMMLKSITYFDDANNYPEPKMFQDFDWEQANKK